MWTDTTQRCATDKEPRAHRQAVRAAGWNSAEGVIAAARGGRVDPPLRGLERSSSQVYVRFSCQASPEGLQDVSRQDGSHDVRCVAAGTAARVKRRCYYL